MTRLLPDWAGLILAVAPAVWTTPCLQAEPPGDLPLRPSLGGLPADPLTGASRRTIFDPSDETPLLPTTSWELGTQHEELPFPKNLQVPLAGSVYLFGQVQKGDEWQVAPGSGKMVGDGGLGLKLPSLAGADLLFKCGPEMSYDGTLKPADRSSLPVRPQWVRLDLQARWSFLGPVGLECQGTALPAFGDTERDRLIQDVRAVIPVGKNGQFQLGAKHTWEYITDTKPWSEATQFYGGFKLGW
jgi:hypothetical protein